MIHKTILAPKPNCRFRPSNWITRIAGNYASFENGRLKYSSLIYPATLNGESVLVIDLKLKDQHPLGFDSLMHFAAQNDLTIQNIVL